MNKYLNKIIQGDCLVEMKKIDNNSIDMILCDLPYGTTACEWDIIIPIKSLWKQYYRIIKSNGVIVLTASQPFTSILVMSNINNFSHQWIWEKEQGSNPLLANLMPMKNFEDVLVFYKDNRDLDLKHPLRKYSEKICGYINYSRTKLNNIFNNYKFQHFLEYKKNKNFNLIQEDFYIKLTEYFNLEKMEGFMEFNELKKIDKKFYIKRDRTYNPQKTSGKAYKISSGTLGEVFGGKLKKHLTENKGDRFPNAIIQFKRDKGLHPTQKPVALFEYLIKTYTNENDLVLDNCAGSFTTAVACDNLKRKWICIEQEEKYCEIGRKRIKENIDIIKSKLF